MYRKLFDYVVCSSRSADKTSISQNPDERSKNIRLSGSHTKTSILDVKKIQNDVKELAVVLFRKLNLLTEDNVADIDLKYIKNGIKPILEYLNTVNLNTKASVVEYNDEKQFLKELQKFEKQIDEWPKPVNNKYYEYSDASSAIVTEPNYSMVSKIPIKRAVSGTSGHPEVELKLHEYWNSVKPGSANWSRTGVKRKKKSTQATQRLNNEKMKLKIAEWKAEKVREEQQKREQELQEEFEKRRLERLQLKTLKQLSDKVRMYRQLSQRTEEEERLKMEMKRLREEKNRAARARKLIKQYQRRDEFFLENKLRNRVAQSKIDEPVRATEQKNLVRANPVGTNHQHNEKLDRSRQCWAIMPSKKGSKIDNRDLHLRPSREKLDCSRPCSGVKPSKKGSKIANKDLQLRPPAKKLRIPLWKMKKVA